MKWAYFVLCLAAFAKGEADDLTANEVACSSSLATKSVELITKFLSPVLNDIKAEIRQSREDTNSRIQVALCMLQNITLAMSGFLAANCDTHICGNKPDAPPTCTVVPPDGSPDCKRTFYICDNILTADSAQAYCQQYGMRLATVETQAIFNYISPHVVAFRKSLGPWSESHGFSLAASDVNSPGQWYWIPSTTPFNFKPWATGEPSGGGEHCLELRQTGDDTLLSFNDYPCDARRFICEHKSA